MVADVDGGRVWLRGSVEWRQRGESVAAQVAALPGIVEVVNEIEVQSSAPEDVRLRRLLFERIYYGGGIPTDPQPRWPVRILVAEGRVTLASAAPFAGAVVLAVLTLAILLDVSVNWAVIGPIALILVGIGLLTRRVL